MRRLLVLLMGLVFLAAASTCSAAQGNGTLRVVGVATVTVPADTAIVSISAQSSDDNSTMATAQAEDKLNRAIDALIASGIRRDEIMPGRSKGVAYYISRTCREFNNTTVCQDIATNMATEQLEIKLSNSHQKRVDGVLSVAKASNVSAILTGYELSDTSEALAEARKKAFQDARSSAEEYASAFGLKLGGVQKIYESGSPHIGRSGGLLHPFWAGSRSGMRWPPIMGPHWAPYFARVPLEEFNQPGMMDVTSHVVVTYEITY